MSLHLVASCSILCLEEIIVWWTPNIHNSLGEYSNLKIHLVDPLAKAQLLQYTSTMVSNHGLV